MTFWDMKFTFHLSKVHVVYILDMVEDTVEVFIDDFSIIGDLFQCCFEDLGKVLEHYVKTNLILN